MAIEQNFTQFAVSHGYPSDYDTLFQAQYLGSLGLAGKVSKRNVAHGSAEFHKMQSDNLKAHDEYNKAILSGEIVDPSGEITKSGIESRLAAQKSADLESARSGLVREIDFIESLGPMSHLRSGALKKPYQRTVDVALEKLAALLPADEAAIPERYRKYKARTTVTVTARHRRSGHSEMGGTR